jgi:phage terminase small subunit
MDELSKKQREFVKEYIDTGHGTNSALKAYDITLEGKTKVEIERTASTIAWENLGKPKIIKAIQDASSIAQSVVVELAQNSSNDSVRLGASKDILDRAGFKPVDKTDHTTGGEKITFNIISYENNNNSV